MDTYRRGETVYFITNNGVYNEKCIKSGIIVDTPEQDKVDYTIMTEDMKSFTVLDEELMSHHLHVLAGKMKS